MKSLNEYLENNINIDLDIQNSLDLHFYTEFVLKDSMRYHVNIIDERYGSYIGQKELILKIAKDIYARIADILNDNKSVFVYSKNDLKEYSNIFFNELKISLHENSTAYVNHLSKFDKSMSLFDKVVITINDKDIESLQDTCSVLMHEMLHAYNNYMDHLKNSKTTLNDLIASDTSYSKTKINSDDLTPENICKRMLHDIRKFEQNAYFSELTNILELNKFNVNDFNNTIEAYKHAKEIFKNSMVWKQYISLYETINFIKTNKKFQKEFVKTYNEVNNVNWTFDKIYKKLHNILESIIKRFETLVSKLFCDYYQKQLYEHMANETTGTTWHGPCGRKYFVEYMNYINEYKNLNENEN